MNTRGFQIGLQTCMKVMQGVMNTARLAAVEARSLHVVLVGPGSCVLFSTTVNMTATI